LILWNKTGVADPSQIATLFWLDSALESVLYLDGILITVDSLNLEMVYISIALVSLHIIMLFKTQQVQIRSFSPNFCLLTALEFL
jgi:G3E family GTPase